MSQEYSKPHDNHQDVLIVVAKRPDPGRTKTRLVPPLSPLQAASLYECFLLDTLDLMRSLPGIHRVIAYLPEQEEAYFQEIAPDFKRLLQTGPDLGARLDNALAHFLAAGYERAVIMDSDSPTLPGEYLRLAFEGLSGPADVVIGPCKDGGYYLIGLNRPAPRLLRGVKMSTPHVTADTMALAAGEGLRVELLPSWYDVDDAASLVRLKKEIDCNPASRAIHTRNYLSRLEIGTFLPGCSLSARNP